MQRVCRRVVFAFGESCTSLLGLAPSVLCSRNVNLKAALNTYTEGLSYVARVVRSGTYAMDKQYRNLRPPPPAVAINDCDATLFPNSSMAADPRSLKHCKSRRFEIKSTQPGSQIYVSIDRFLLAIIMLKKEKTSSVISLTLSCLVLSCLVLSCLVSCPAECGRSACREGSLFLVRG